MIHSLMKPWFSRFRHYPLSVLGHIAWGVGAGWVGGVDGAVLFSGGLAYQFGSGWRKYSRGDIDTVGMDAFDYAVGYLIGNVARRALQGA